MAPQIYFGKDSMTRFKKKIAQLQSGHLTHALIRGDCLRVGRDLPDELVDSVIIDPPYGMNYCGLNNKQKPIANDNAPFVWWLEHAYRVCKPHAALACFCNWRNQEAFRLAIELAGFTVRNQAIWWRSRGGMGHPTMTMAPSHDVIWFATKGRFRFPGKRPISVFDVPNVPTTKRHHTTQKPDKLMRELVRSLTPQGGVVYDPTMGSGSTGVGALLESRRFIGVEQDPENYAIACQRIRQADTDSQRAPKAKLARPTHYTPARAAA